MAELNKNLVENYWQLWRKQQCNYKDDGYFYQHIIDHAIEARHKETLQGLMTDLKWMRAKVIACNTLHCLYADILKYMKSTHLSETTAIMDISELYDFLRQNQSYFNLEKMDFSQFLLSCSSHNSWIQEKALQIVDSKAKEDNFKFHVMMTAYPTPSFSYLTFWNNNKLIGRCWNDVLPRLSNGSIDNSKIISTHYNGTLDSCIVVIDNQTGDTKYKLPLPAIWVEEVRISSDSKLMAYSSQGIWEVSGNKIQRTTKSIASQQEITLFQTLPKGGKFLLLRKKYNQHQGQQEKDWVNECLIEIWNILPFFCHQSIRVPGRIKCDGNSYSISKHGNKAMELSHVQYTSNDYLNIVALYHSKAYKGSVLGLLTMVNRGNTSIDFITMWKRHFKIIHHDPKCINHSAISDDGQYLAILNGQGNLMVFRIDGNSISEYVIINCMQTIRQLLFVPTGYDLLTYDCSSQKLYGFTVTDRNLKWQKMDSESKIAFRQCHNEDYNCGKVLDSSCTFIDCIPYVTKLMKMNDESLRLIVYTGESLEAISKCNLGEYKCERKYSCFLFHNLDSIVVVQRYKCNQTHWTKLVTTSHWHFSLVQYDNIQMPAADSKQVEHIFDNSDYNLTITEAVYRASDKKLIFILKMLYPDLFQKFAIFIIDRPSGNKVIYCENVHNIQLSTMIYCDDRNCILHQWLINGDHAIKWYRIGDDINKSALVKEHQYKYYNGLACKIDTPNKKSLQDVNLLISPWDTISMLETFNTADTELFVSCCGYDSKYAIY
ncbi:uncharacterized protein TRIADDRAFT_60562 [Trichoplax adhaerens]|uniref:APAF-1 helical domain-containing protein n=1 Tax=Trichoplax adhaerens TaxID=10228 RepID=B3S8J4_TRIAD|nr:predicted protein [Trichoplax adhaerens]EDV20894.1 predicted protein [Trichoplax adhaerens]|eukprot:XP_002116538.1 predicted protein [Trichoplax adhaerens]